MEATLSKAFLVEDALNFVYFLRSYFIPRPFDMLLFTNVGNIIPKKLNRVKGVIIYNIIIGNT